MSDEKIDTGLHDRRGHPIFFGDTLILKGHPTAIFTLKYRSKSYGFIDPHLEWIEGKRDWSWGEFAYDHSSECDIIIYKKESE